jgi:soluble lytic murein transglycosylase-like protein
MRRLCALVAVLLVAGCGGGPDPRPVQAPTPTATPTPARETLAERMTRVHAELRTSIRAWLDGPEGDAAPLPPAVERAAAEQQRLYMRLTSRKRLADRVLPRLPGPVRAEARDVLAARRAIAVLNRPRPGQELPRLKVRPPEPAATIRAHYRAARRRFGVGLPLLAAVHFVETRFGRIRNDSVAGAQGPMQFIPATWAAYGLGGDVQDPRDAILGAANYLRANGAPRRERRALFRYNPSPLYVQAVSRYARAMRRDPLAFHAFYAWPVRR